jgi:hypothetical protein
MLYRQYVYTKNKCSARAIKLYSGLKKEDFNILYRYHGKICFSRACVRIFKEFRVHYFELLIEIQLLEESASNN